MTELFFADLVRETSQTSGIENMLCDGPVVGYRSFASSVPAGRTFYYAISHIDNPTEWEVGIGHLDAQSLIVRSPIISSQNDERVDFSLGRKNINLTISADWFNQQNGEALEHHHGLASIDGLVQALASKQDAGDYANAEHRHSYADLGIDTLAAQNYLNANDRFTLAVDALGQNFVTVAGDAIPARRTEGGNIISPTTLEIPSGRVQLAYAVSSPTTGPAIRWGTSFTKMLGLYINAGLNYQGDQFNSSFNIRTQTEDGTLGAVTVILNSREASRFRYGISPMRDNKSNIGSAGKRFSNLYLTNNPIVTSDERHKENIAAITDQMLDWYSAIIQWKNFTLKGEDGKAGDGKIQIGVLAQDIERGAKALGMDDSQIAAMGLLNYQKWDAEYEENPALDEDGFELFDDDGQPIMHRTLIQEAGDSYGVKYDQLFALASAWSLRETKRQQAEINALKVQVNALIEPS